MLPVGFKVQMLDRARALEAREEQRKVDFWLREAALREVQGLKGNAESALRHALTIEENAKARGLFF